MARVVRFCYAPFFLFPLVLFWFSLSKKWSLKRSNNVQKNIHHTEPKLANWWEDDVYCHHYRACYIDKRTFSVFQIKLSIVCTQKTVGNFAKFKIHSLSPVRKMLFWEFIWQSFISHLCHQYHDHCRLIHHIIFIILIGLLFLVVQCFLWLSELVLIMMRRKLHGEEEDLDHSNVTGQDIQWMLKYTNRISMTYCKICICWSE